MNIVIMGASFDTGNLGVSALGYSILAGIARIYPDAKITMLCFTKGWRTEYVIIDGRVIELETYGSFYSKRFLRPDNLWNMTFCSFFGGLYNKCVKNIKNADFVLDITGGDSFTDMYGAKRFKATLLRKKIVLRMKTPLILLPQTYGPFKSIYARKEAKRIMEKASCIWTRDRLSVEVIKNLNIGSEVLEKIHIGADLAFQLPAIKPQNSHLVQCLEGKNKKNNIGININGLLYNRSKNYKDFKIKIHYEEIMDEIIDWFLSNTAVNIYLISHVLGNEDDETSDSSACYETYQKVKASDRNRVKLVDVNYNQNEVKWVIAQLNWFCGARMHSTIASISSKVPTASLSYSDKAKGVFEICGADKCVIDLRIYEENKNVMKLVIDSYRNREKTKRYLEKIIPDFLDKSKDQIERVLRKS
ncbi:hypothetical protein B4O97_15935 [Marispirochaeta aestuarii]|uniref:Polysaccharide pyruvyl transferase domain-containing protein n=1 Tax=Marispirochaeta aestuarii TaxID=1963862 RepID=A0A1Y1RVI7_9SPIO|nr:polysaccharide pyruvyl transferase family protein [Marispirochaeta aestuarii]ORC32648.1 hypothetical protein B4O97_15935 [Marispirochaeta aestuarii]